MGRFDDAVAAFDTSLELVPDNNTVHGYKGFSLLAAGRLEHAWEEWEYGIQGGPRGEERLLGVPRWTPDDVDTRVLVYREQGVGDEILLSSCYPDLIAAARDVVIECDARVVPLFARSFPRAEVRAQTVDAFRNEAMSDFDHAIPAGSLPLHFRRSLADFPDRRSHLKADPERVRVWKERLAELGPGPYVGLSWRSKVKTAERRLEYTRLDEWGPIFANEGVTWINLQYDECERELYAAEESFGVKIHRWEELDLMNDFDEIAALNTALDLVLAPRNAVAMLSSSLGVRTITLGNRYGWPQLGTDYFPWLPALELVTRLPNEEWDHVIARAAEIVAQTVQNAVSRV